MSCWTACTSGSTVERGGAAVTTGAAAWVAGIVRVGVSGRVDGGFAVAVGKGAGASGAAVGCGSSAAIGDATATGTAGGDTVAAWVATAAAAAAPCAAAPEALGADAGEGVVIRPARNPAAINATVSAARIAQPERRLRKGLSASASSCALSSAGGRERATGGTGTEGGTGTHALAGTGLAAGGSSTSSASSGRSSAMGGAVDGVGRGGRGGGRLVAGFVALRLSVGIVSLSLSRPMGPHRRTLRACGEGRSRPGKHARGVVGPVTA